MDQLLVPMSTPTAPERHASADALPNFNGARVTLDPAFEALLWEAFKDTFQRVRMAQSVQAATQPPALARSDRREPMPLSARECEVLAQVAAGNSNKHIARALDLSPHTVKRHIANILDKLDARSRGQAAAWWLARG